MKYPELTKEWHDESSFLVILTVEDEDALYNPRLHRRYRIQDDIPIMLIDESIPLPVKP